MSVQLSVFTPYPACFSCVHEAKWCEGALKNQQDRRPLYELEGTVSIEEAEPDPNPGITSSFLTEPSLEGSIGYRRSTQGKPPPADTAHILYCMYTENVNHSLRSYL